MINKPHVDWFALSPSLALIGVAACCCSSPCSCRGTRASLSRLRRASRLRRLVRARGAALRPQRRGRDALVHDAIFRDRWAALAQVLLAGSGAVAVLDLLPRAMREEHIAEYYALLAAAGAGMAFFVQASNLMTLFLGLEWFSIALYVLTAIDIDLIGSLEAGLKYLIVGAVGSATLLFGSALVYGTTGELSFDKIAPRGHGARRDARRRARDGDRRASRSRRPRRRSTCGRPTPTRARRRR